MADLPSHSHLSPYPSFTAPRGPEDLYTSPPPWDIGRPQPAFRALADAGAIQGRVLDVGCGTGANGWRIDSIEPATIDITTDPNGIRAWLTALTRT
jgi:hypothetical protein